MAKLSVVLATRNEEENIIECLKSVERIADEIVVVDEYSDDKTRELAESIGARVYFEPHHKIFHVTKQKALSLAKYEWILQLDADERVGDDLAREIKEIIRKSDNEIDQYQQSFPQRRIFMRHQALMEKRGNKIGKDNSFYAGFFIARKNYFLGKYLRYGGVYPDGVIRLVKKGYAKFPCKSVHEQIEINGRVGWLKNPLIHMADKSFKRYLDRNNRYIDLITKELSKDKLKKNFINFINYMLIMPITWFLLTQIRHKGILDGWQGVVFSFFSALRFPRAYWRYLNIR